MKKRTFSLLFCCFLLKNAFAQVANFDRVVFPVEQKAKDFSEYLVQLAWLNNPSNNVLTYKKNIAEQEVKLAKKEWLNAVGVSGGRSIQPVILTQPIFSNDTIMRLTGFRIDQDNKTKVSSMSVGININFGMLLTSKNKTQVAREQVKIAESNIDQQKLAIRAEALTRYQNFKLALEILKTRTQVEQDAKNTFDLMTQLFKTDEAKFEEYNQAATSFHQTTENRIKAEADYQLAKIQLEEIIGLRWEEVVHPNKDK